MGMRNIGIMELMMCSVKPVPIRSPMVQITLSIATNIAGITRVNLRKKKYMRTKMSNPASGA